MMDIATWAREYFEKSLSLNTVRRCIKEYNLKLYYVKRKAFINNFGQKRHRVLWAQSHLRLKHSGNVFSGQTSPHFSLFLGETHIGCAKDEKDQPDPYQRKLQKPAFVMV